MTFLVSDGMVQVAFVAIGATMVGSITFLKKEGDYVHKGDEVFFMHFLLIYCDNFFWCLCEGVKLSVPCFFPLYSSLGISPLEGAQWYASSRRFCHASVLTKYSSILFIKIVAAHPYSKMKLLLMKLWLCMAGCDPIWCWSCGKQGKVTGNPFCWYDKTYLFPVLS